MTGEMMLQCASPEPLWMEMLRLAGSSWDDLLPLREDGLARTLAELRTDEAAWREDARRVAEQVSPLVAVGALGQRNTDLPATEWRRELLSLRRDLFNGRLLQPKHILRLRHSTPPQLDAAAARVVLNEALRCAHDGEKGSARWRALEEQHGRALLAGQSRLRASAASAAWLRGVALRSDTALLRLQDWFGGRLPPGSKRERQAVTTALGYASRAVAKASPRSTFTPIALPRTRREGPEYRTSTALFGCLVDSLLAEIDERTLPPVRVNPTLQERDERLTWFAWERGLEVRRSIAATSLLRTLCAVAEEGATLDELVERVAGSSHEEHLALEGVVRRLLACGLLLPVLPTGPEDFQFEAVLLRWAEGAGKDSLSHGTRAFLRRMGAALEALDRAPVVEVAERTRTLRRELSGAQGATHRGTVEDALFENVFEAAPIKSHTSLQRTVGTFLGALEKLPPLAHAGWRVGQRLAAAFGRLGRLSFLDAVPEIAAAVEMRQGEWEACPVRCSYRGLVSSDELRLDEKALRACPVERDFEADQKQISAVWGAYVQTAGEQLPVLNRVTPGYGARSARFLRDMDQETGELRERAARLSQSAATNGVRWAEVRSAFWSTANQSPALFESALELPFVRRAPWQRPVRPSQLDVEFAPGGLPRLIHRETGEQIVPVWLGLERWSRSPLLKALQAFAPTSWEHPWYALLRDINRRCHPAPLETSGEVVRFPRVTFEGRLTLQRRSWWIPGAELAGLQAASPFLRWVFVRTLQRRWDLPEAVFVQTYDPERAPREGKPQLVLLDAPLFVDVLLRTWRRSPIGVLVTACDPEPRAGERVRELLLEWEVGP